MTRSARLAPLLRLRHQEAAEVVGLGDRRRQAGHAETRRKPPKPRQAEREQIAALGGDQRVQLVEHDALEAAEQIGRVGAGEQQRQLLRRGQQDVGRIAALALALRGRRVAGAGLDADRQAHLADRRFEVARDVDRERLQRRDVERVQALRAPQVLAGRNHPARLGAALAQAPPGSAETPPASCRRRSARSAAPSGRRGRAPAIPADARAGVQPRDENHREKFSGSSGAVSIFFARLMSSGSIFRKSPSSRSCRCRSSTDRRSRRPPPGRTA